MVGIVVVSHSRVLAEALVKLALQVANADVPIAFSGGAGPDHDEFGTDAVDIQEAIQAVFSEDGVLVLMDLGSAILSAELALDLLDPEMKDRTRLSPCPLVEGTITAVVQSGLGSDLETVFRESQNALAPKSEHLGIEAADELTVEGTYSGLSGAAAINRSITLLNEHGLHARPAALFVQIAAKFDAEIAVSNARTGKGPVPAKSLNGLATLGAVRGDQLLISASGPQAAMALEALIELVETGFGEELQPEEEPTPQAPARDVKPESTTDGAALLGQPIVEGIAIGPMVHYSPPPIEISKEPAASPDIEWARFQDARVRVVEQIRERRSRTQARLGPQQAAIFDAHRLILEDPQLLDQVHTEIFEQLRNAAQAWAHTFQSLATAYRSLEDEYLRQRAVDVEDIGNQLLHHLSGGNNLESLFFSEPVILVADELTPTQTAQLDLERVLGLISEQGGPTSHSAILARGLGIPYISGVAARLADVNDKTLVGMDGFNGQVFIGPEGQTLERLKAARETWIERNAQEQRARLDPARTRDGQHIEILANAGGQADAEAALQNGAEGIGLLRTEFIYLTRTSPPSEDEQYDILYRIAGTIGDLPITIRTLDIGGDKFLPFLDQEPEANPFLGERAIRLSLREQSLFRSQISAILRAGQGGHVRIMFPMITGLEEIHAITRIMEECHQSLEAEHIPHIWPIEAGIMVETPAAALMSPQLAPHVDFFSVGTNDLNQYTLAAERGNHRLERYQDSLNPALLKLVRLVTEAAHSHGKWVGVCGELAGDPQAIPILLGLGVDELSMSPRRIGGAKAVIRRLSLQKITPLAEQAVNLETTDQVRRMAEEFLASLDPAG
ncbi:MAG: phosphoenolpyruvate--protein phosphotransferase [Anaerolineales bacterium]|nr:phosphoenolpyruvate--protein phosphotransferase [Anaerolineales bacterium]